MLYVQEQTDSLMLLHGMEKVEQAIPHCDPNAFLDACNGRSSRLFHCRGSGGRWKMAQGRRI